MNKKLRKIVVYGNLRKFLGRSYFEAAVNSPQQAFNFLKANFQGIEKHMSQQIYKIRMGNRIGGQPDALKKVLHFFSGTAMWSSELALFVPR